MRKTFPVLILLLLLTTEAYTSKIQGSKPTTVWGGKPDNRQLLDVANLAGPMKDCFRLPKPIVGTIVRRQFAEDELTVSGLVIRDAKDERTLVNIDIERLRQLPYVEQENFSEFVSLNKPVRVWVYACGAAGRMLIVDRIQAGSTNAAVVHVPLTNQSKLAINGIGPIRVGMTLAEASKSLGRRLIAGKRISDGDCLHATPEKGPSGIAFMVVDGRISRVEIDSKRITTKRGAGIGSSEARVKSLYPGQIQVTRHKYDETGHYLTFVPKDQKDQAYRVVFETDGKRVTSFRSGKVPDVEWIEGCL